MIVTGETSLCRWAFGQGPVERGDIDAFVAHIRGTVDRPGLVLVDILHNLTPAPAATDRRRIADAVNDVLVPCTAITGHAVVLNSAIALGAVTAMNWAVKTPFPEATFSSPERALAWARSRSPALDESAVLAAWRAQIPGFAALQWKA